MTTSILFLELLGGIGDVVLALPAIHALARTHAPAEVTVATFSPGDQLLRTDPLVGRVVVVERGDGRPRLAVEGLLAEGGWDVVVSDVTYDGIDRLVAGCGARAVSDLWRSPPPDELIDRRFLHLLVADGLVDHHLADLGPAVHLTADERAAAEAWWPPGGPRVLLVPESGMAIKQWADHRWVELAVRLGADHGATLALVEGVADTALDAPGAVVLPLGPLRLASAVAGAADLVVAPDTGLARVATALGTPTVCLYGPTVATRYGLRRPGIDLMSPVPCDERNPLDMTTQACWYSGRCVFPDRRSCVDQLSVDEVAVACSSALTLGRLAA